MASSHPDHPFNVCFLRLPEAASPLLRRSLPVFAPDDLFSVGLIPTLSLPMGDWLARMNRVCWEKAHSLEP